MYEDYDLYRGQDRRDVILMNSDDLARLGLKHEQRVTVRSEVGALTNVRARAFDKIKAGNALMYYPEANALVPRHVDPASRTPAFKNVLVTVEAAGTQPDERAASEPLPLQMPVAGTTGSTRDSMRAC